MKPKKLSKKMTLNKSTIANLSKNEMRDLNGGGLPTFEGQCTAGCTDQWLCSLARICFEG